MVRTASDIHIPTFPNIAGEVVEWLVASQDGKSIN
jgi:hypothetical protein